MLLNCLAAALRNLAHNRLYTAIIIIGLGTGFTAALLIALFVRDELSYDTWIPGHEQVYRISFTLNVPGQGPALWDYTPGHVGPWLALDFPQVKAVGRLSRPRAAAKTSIRTAEVEGMESVYWADSSLADVLALPTIAGDFAAALRDPAGIVVTRRIARKYFGRDNPIGETLEIDREHPM